MTHEFKVHNFVEYSNAAKTHCVGDCHGSIQLGELRFGVNVDKVYHNPPIHHTSINWRHMGCLTKAQADFAIEEASKNGVSLKDWLVVPPPPSTGGDGPEEEVLDLVIELLMALHNENTTCHHHEKKKIKTAGEILKQLNEYRSTIHDPSHVDYKVDGELDQKAMESNAEIVDIGLLDKQIRGDNSILKFLSLHDLKAIAINHKVSIDDSMLHDKNSLVSTLQQFYSTVA